MTDIEIPDAARRAREMYRQGATVAAIKAETGLTHHQLYRWLEGSPGGNGASLLPPLPKRRIVKRTRITAGDRMSVIARIMRSAERQIAEIDRRLGNGQDGDKDARALALLARTVRELTAVDMMNHELEAPAAKRGAEPDDDQPPEDIEQFRAELTRRINSIIASESAAASDPDDQAQDA
jgi:hypothetical protein